METRSFQGSHQVARWISQRSYSSTAGIALRILTTQPVLELVGGCVEQSIPVLISVPGKAGHCYALVELNKMLAPAVRSLNLERARAAMVEAVNYAYHIHTDPIKPLGSCL